MIKFTRKNHAFDRIGDSYGPYIDPEHFLGRSAFDIPYKKNKDTPPVNMKEGGKDFELELIIPGFTKEEITITVEEDILIVKGEKARVNEENNRRYVLEEYQIQTFERSFHLDPKIARDKVEAHYENGILRLVFLKANPKDATDYQMVHVE